MTTINEIYKKIQDANAQLCNANRILLEVSEMANRMVSDQNKAANQLLNVLFDENGSFRGRNMSGMSKTTTRVLNELNRKNYPVTVNTLARVTGYNVKTVHTSIWDLRRRGFNIEKVDSGKNKKKYKLQATAN
tara:strand:- start:374 stop:772 length:399 start_codon:yes stop_codon:yes gene_type:complete